MNTVSHEPENPARDLIRALERAERERRSFVALKWFRDQYLPQQGFPWAVSPEARQSAIRQVIEGRWVLTSKVPNPKTPEFPVTAIALNRPHPRVQEILANMPPSGDDFEPIEISGEPLSATILRDRR